MFFRPHNIFTFHASLPKCNGPISESYINLMWTRLNKLPAEIRNNPAAILYRKHFKEFIKNAVDAGSTQLTVIAELTRSKVMITIKDTGRGIPDETALDYSKDAKEGICSTKKKKQTNGGYGMGLAIAAKYLQQNHGMLKLRNNHLTRGANVKLIARLKPERVTYETIHLEIHSPYHRKSIDSDFELKRSPEGSPPASPRR